MSTQAPRVMSRKTNGVLPVPTSETNETPKVKGPGDRASTRSGRGRGSGERNTDSSKQNDGSQPRPPRSRAHNEGEKLVVRRLPPAMTESEFTTILGPDWDIGKGKVDWFLYSPGKVSKDPAKPSRPSRAYLRVMKKDSIMPLSDVVRTSSWEDAKGSASDLALIGPPVLELSVYKKVPSNKKRADARQGTIDQDPEFMAFLEELANPAPLRDGPGEEADDDTAKSEPITTTPLVEYLREKKAKAKKEASANKKDNKSGKGKGAQKEDEPSKKKAKDAKGSKADKPSKETVKILTKKAGSEPAGDATKPTTDQDGAAISQEAPKSRRAGIAAAARLLQRDLGLSPGSAHRRARQDAAKSGGDDKGENGKEATGSKPERPASPAPEKSADSASQSSKSRPTTPTAQQKPSSSGRRTRGSKKGAAADGKPDQSSQATTANPPVILKKKGGADATDSPAEAPTKDSVAPNKQGTNAAAASKESPRESSKKSTSAQKKQPNPSTNAVRGFVKNVSSSQGMTESSLRQALETFGPVASIELEKRKGFAFVEFSDHEGLVKAMSASPVTVGQGTVTVVERKDKKAANAEGGSGQSGGGGSEKSSGRGRRGRGGGGGGKNSASAKQEAASAAANGSSG